MNQPLIKQRPSLTIVRRIKAPPAKIYAALTRPDLISRWWGDGGPVLTAEIDPRVGGSFRIAFQALNGETHECSGDYRQVETDRRLVFSWSWISTPERVSEVDIALKAIPEGTEMTLTHAQFFDEAARDLHSQGWEYGLDRLTALVTGE